MKRRVWLLSALFLLALPASAEQPVERHPFGPHYKPSGSSKKAVDIATDAYGAFSLAPKAPSLGAKVADFELPTVDGRFSLKDARTKGDTVIVFYRGHW